MPSKANGTPFILNVAIFFICVRTHLLNASIHFILYVTIKVNEVT
jgi:hypothetical protein|nr:MAG TPA: hypothetical protein [Caudoviricetes sp.]DAY72546.1 MAG TPA: hypothetical protein [Caudoviricetes sp.]